MTTLAGGCLCGGIRYEVAGEIDSIVFCHCSMCRKAHGSAFRTRGGVRRQAFRFVRGEELLELYRSSDNTLRGFCRTCGSPIINRWDGDPEGYGLALGSLDDDPIARPWAHIYVDSKAPWYEIGDDLPQFAEGPRESD